MLMAAEWSRLNKFPLGRIAFALSNTAERALALPEPRVQVAELANRGAELARQGLLLDSEFRSLSASRGRFPRRTHALDRRLDQCMVGFDGFLVSQITLFGHNPRGQAAQRLRTALYPEGVSAITHLPYTAQHERITVLLRNARSPELVDDVAELPELELILAELDACNNAYGEALREANERPTGAEVRAVRLRCQELLSATMSLIFGLYGLADPDQLAERDHLLEPILDQNTALREARRRNATSPDTDPDTGQEIDDDPDADDSADDVADDGAADTAGEPENAADDESLAVPVAGDSPDPVAAGTRNGS